MESTRVDRLRLHPRRCRSMNLATRARRTIKVSWTAGIIYSSYKIPSVMRQLTGRPPLKDDELSSRHEKTALRILDLALDMRGVMIKMCQAMATRSDVFPPEFITHLEQCHDAVPAKSFGVIRKIVEREFGKPMDALFSEFAEEPIASASLAQVHRARLQDGREVAVKVQYPDIEDIIRTDLANMRRVCRVYEFFDRQPLELLPLLTELTEHIGYELDFVREANFAGRVRDLFESDDHVKIPECYPEFTTQRVLVMELISGIKITDIERIKAAGLEPEDVVQDLMNVYVRMILAAGFFQADPHPGNLFVTEEGQIIVLDFGLSKELPEGFGLGLFELMFSLMTFNEQAMLRAFDELGFRSKTGDNSTFLLIARRMVSRSDSGSFEGEFTEQMTDELFDAIREDPIAEVPSDFVLVSRVFSLLSGIAHTLGGRANVLAAMGGG
ncbi:MAG TPA: AarF/ABC1/UbiB kinase family protein [Myxococcales bacterium]|nr:AarF/ABC1/UbiB kinase family protein [Myxococcales bacterium]HIK85956.1 AarF/ABC1/UbiB kinase family protein [Myxococcales bacterium]